MSTVCVWLTLTNIWPSIPTRPRSLLPLPPVTRHTIPITAPSRKWNVRANLYADFRRCPILSGIFVSFLAYYGQFSMFIAFSCNKLAWQFQGLWTICYALFRRKCVTSRPKINNYMNHFLKFSLYFPYIAKYYLVHLTILKL